MSNSNTPPLYALLPITDTEGLPNGQYRCVNKYGKESDVKYSFDDGRWIAHVAIELYQFTHYLRPLPEGAVAVSEEELRKLSDFLRTAVEHKCSLSFIDVEINQFIQTKLAQMGE